MFLDVKGRVGKKRKVCSRLEFPNKSFPFPSLCVMSHHPPHTCTLTSTFFPAWPAQHFHPRLPHVEEKRQTPTMGSLMLQDFIYFFTLNPEFYSVGGDFVLFCFLYPRISVRFDSSLLHRCTAQRTVQFPGSFKPCLPWLESDKVFSLLPFIPESLTNIH